jgi:predicted nucleic acid-binding protein
VELADSSAWAWAKRTHLRDEFDALIASGELATCDMVKLELLYSTRNAEEFEALADDLQALRGCPIGQDEWLRALWVYGELANQGGMHQRSVRHPDLLVAAAAEAAGVPVLHYDEDFERIAEITGQEHRWLAAPGSL